MGMSTHVTGYVSPENETYKKHARVLRACLEAEVTLPKETAEYFGEKYPYLYLLDEKLETEIKVHKWSKDMSSGYEIILSEIPKDVHKIRFYNSH